jgi:hypothetical protein
LESVLAATGRAYVHAVYALRLLGRAAVDLTPEASQENLARLSLALKELGARIRTEAVLDGLPFSHDATSLAAADVWNLICPDGEFDILLSIRI